MQGDRAMIPASLHPLHARIVSVNAAASAAYVGAESARRRYWARHRTFLACVKCMDGRVLLPVMTDTPIGIVKPFRAIGGRFEAFWPSFLGRVHAWVDDAVAHGADAALFVSYHHSASDPHLGCAGWGYDTAAARAHAERLKRDLAAVFGDALSAIVIGIETDQDAITFHGVGGDVSGAALTTADAAEIERALGRALPDLPAEVRRDLLPLLEGNARRVAHLQRAPRDKTALGHDERILGVGQGFDWLAEENLALIVNDADPGLAESIRVAAGILERNLDRLDQAEVATVLTSIPYRDPGIARRQAETRARGLLHFTEEVVKRTCPALWQSGRLLSLAGVVWAPARRLELLT